MKPQDKKINGDRFLSWLKYCTFFKSANSFSTNADLLIKLSSNCISVSAMSTARVTSVSPFSVISLKYCKCASRKFKQNLVMLERINLLPAECILKRLALLKKPLMLIILIFHSSEHHFLKMILTFILQLRWHFASDHHHRSDQANLSIQYRYIELCD